MALVNMSLESKKLKTKLKDYKDIEEVFDDPDRWRPLWQFNPNIEN